jgi:hypothetical protein
MRGRGQRWGVTFWGGGREERREERGEERRGERRGDWIFDEKSSSFFCP